MEQNLFLALAWIAGVIASDPVSSACCAKKTVGGTPYTLVERADTSDYKCLANCVYERDDSPGGARFCFAGGYLDVVCNEDTTASTTTTTTTTPGTTTITTTTLTTTTTARTTNSTTITGILIAGGTTSEVFLPGSGKTCALADLPERRYDHTLDAVGTTALLCGAGTSDEDSLTSCLQFSQNTGTWTRYATTLKDKRGAHTSWVSPSGLLLMGGYFSAPDTVLRAKTTEIVDGGMNFTLAEQSINACSIQEADSTIITGGRYTMTTVSRYNLQGHAEDLPNLSQGRADHGCGAYHNGEDRILVVAGGRSAWSNTGFSSTEVHIIGSAAWTAGEALPRALNGMGYASLDTAVIMIGGKEDDRQRRDEILFYNGSWTEVGKLGDIRGYSLEDPQATKILVNSTICD